MRVVVVLAVMAEIMVFRESWRWGHS